MSEPSFQRVTCAKRIVRKCEQLLPFTSRHTHHFANNIKRNTRGDITSLTFQGPHDYIVCDIAHLGIQEANGSRREPVVHQRPELAMAWWVRQSQGTAAARVATVILGPQQDAACRTEGGRIAVHGADVIVLCDGPESWKLRRRVSVHRIMFP